MIEKYLTSAVSATDTNAFKPADVPSNLLFEIDDAEGEWTFGGLFDLFHLKGLTGSFKAWE